MYNSIKCRSTFALRRHVYVYIDTVDDDGSYHIDKVLPQEVFSRVRFGKEFVRDDFGRFTLCTLRIRKKFIPIIEESLKKLDKDLSIIYGRSYTEILEKFNEIFYSKDTTK